MTSNYESRLRQQQLQYTTGAEVHALPSIYHYWSNRYLAPCLHEVFGSDSITEIYAVPLMRICDEDKTRKRIFVSIGSGDCSMEIQIAKHLLAAGRANFELLGLEVADALIKEANAAILRERLTAHICTKYFDVNRDDIQNPVDAFIAHHSLHHIVELERLFDFIDKSLHVGGHFISCDMIGRNGHMRWPETLRYVEAIWMNLSSAKKFNWQHRQHHEQFLNWDCAQEGFEGVRAQDILPLLLSRFSFEKFVAFGGIIDPFIDRGYGPNFDPDNVLDCDFIDIIASANDALIDAGKIKPTMMAADMIKKIDKIYLPRVVGKRTPQFCVRLV